MDRQRHPDETTTRIAAFVPEDEEVPWIRVLVRPGTADLQGKQDESSIDKLPSTPVSRL